MTLSEAGRELVYPLREPALLASIVVMALLSALAAAAGVFGLWLGLLVLGAFLKYLTDVLLARALGVVPPAPTIESFNLASDLWKLLAAALALQLIAATVIVGLVWGEPAASVTALVSLAVYPAAAAIMAVERSPAAIVRWDRLVRLVAILGWDYAAIPLLVFVALLLAAGLAALGLPVLVVDVLRVYVIVLYYSLIGAALYRHRDALGLAVHAAPEIDAAREQRIVDRRRTAYVDRAYAFFSRGNMTGGINELKRMLSDEGETLEVSRWLYTRLASWSLDGPVLAFAPRFVSELLTAGEASEALAVFAAALERDPALRLPNETAAALGAAARRLGRDDLADRIGALR